MSSLATTAPPFPFISNSIFNNIKARARHRRSENENKAQSGGRKHARRWGILFNFLPHVCTRWGASQVFPPWQGRLLRRRHPSQVWPLRLAVSATAQPARRQPSPQSQHRSPPWDEKSKLFSALSSATISRCFLNLCFHLLNKSSLPTWPLRTLDA